MNSKLLALSNRRRISIVIGGALIGGTLIGGAHLLNDRLNRHATLVGIVTANVAGTVLFRFHPRFVLEKIRSSSIAKPLLSSFVHVDVPHLLSNVVVLSTVWGQACEIFGPGYATALYCTSAVVASCHYSSSSINKQSTTVGARGAVSALVAAVLCKVDIGPIIAPTGAIGLIVTSAVLHKLQFPAKVDHISHLSGFMTGCSAYLLWNIR